MKYAQRFKDGTNVLPATLALANAVPSVEVACQTAVVYQPAKDAGKIKRPKGASNMSHYEHVHEYLTWVRRALEVARQGGTIRTYWNTEYKGVEFVREFREALDRRINLKGQLPVAMRVPCQVSVYHVGNDGQVYGLGGRVPQRDAYSYIGWRNLGDAQQIKAVRYRVHHGLSN